MTRPATVLPARHPRVPGRTLLALGVLSLLAAAASAQTPDPVQSSIVATPQTGAMADLEEEVTVVVTVRDAAGVPIPGVTVRVDSDVPDDLVAQPVRPTNWNGVAVATVATDVAGTHRLTATVDPGGADVLLAQAPLVEFDTPPVRPNVIVVLLDDVGTDALALFDELNPYRADLPYEHGTIGAGDAPGNGPGTSNLYVNAPTLSQLAAEGVTFLNAYAMPLCSPSRATLLTGNYPVRHGVGHVIRYDNLGGTLNEFGDPGFGFTTIPQTAQLQGYADALFGKWHLGLPDDVMVPNGGQPYYMDWSTIPLRGHFSYWHAVLVNVDSAPVPPPDGTFYNFWYNENHTDHADVVADGPETTYASTVQFDDARNWCNAQSGPFVCIVTPTAAHSPWDELPPQNLLWTEEYADPPLNAWTGYMAAVEALDSKIGDLWNGLLPEVRQRTTIVVIGDNGTPDVVLEHARATGPISSTVGSDKDLGQTYDFLLDSPDGRFKQSVYEKGSRVPMIVAGFGVVNPGRTSMALVDISDIHPTIAELLNTELEEEVHGVSMVPVLHDEADYATHARQHTFTELFTPLGSTGPGTSFSQRTIGCSLAIPGQGRYKIVYDQALGADRFYKLQDADGSFRDPWETVDLPHSSPADPEYGNYLLVLAKLEEIVASGDHTGPTECFSAESFCSSGPNSTGQPALIHGEGSCSVVTDDFELVAGPVPQQFGVFFYSAGQVNGGAGVPYGNGLRCVGGNNDVIRLPITVVQGGELRHALDLANPLPGGEISVGSTWHFQAWYRDPAGGGAGFDLSDGMTVTFGP